MPEDADVLGFERKAYDDFYDRVAFRDAMLEQSRLNFAGRRSLAAGEGSTYLKGIKLETIETKRGRNPLTGAVIESPVQRPVSNEVSPLQPLGSAHGKS